MPLVFWCFKGVQRVSIGMKWVNLFCINVSRYITPFHATGLFLYPLKIQIFSGGIKREQSDEVKVYWPHYTAKKMNFSIKFFLGKCEQICRKLRVWSHLLKKFLMENIIFCAVLAQFYICTFLCSTWVVSVIILITNYVLTRYKYVTNKN